MGREAQDVQVEFATNVDSAHGLVSSESSTATGGATSGTLVAAEWSLRLVQSDRERESTEPGLVERRPDLVEMAISSISESLDDVGQVRAEGAEELQAPAGSNGQLSPCKREAMMCGVECASRACWVLGNCGRATSQFLPDLPAY